MRSAWRRIVAGSLVAFACVAAAGCGEKRRPPRPPRAPFVPATQIVVCGDHYEIGTPVVIWSDPIGFDAYAERCRFSNQILPAESASRPDASPLRYGERSRKPATLRELQALVRLVVVHYDAVGSSERCFRALQDNRGLSAHFLLDLDGTLYQTLDLRERAFHAKDVNDVSIGIEIANIGGMSTPKLLQAWYGRDEDGLVRNLFPPEKQLGIQRRTDVVPRPARQEPVVGVVQTSKFLQYDFTNEQYDALVTLVSALSRLFPRVRLDAPRDRQGRIPQAVLPDRAWERFEGLVGHYHLDPQKFDPGPAFDWERVLKAARRHAAEAAAEARQPR